MEEEAAAQVKLIRAKKGKKATPSFANLEDNDSEGEHLEPKEEEVEEEVAAPVQRSNGKKSKKKKADAAFAALSLEEEETEEADVSSRVQSTSSLWCGVMI